jgi:hypothetical protein
MQSRTTAAVAATDTTNDSNSTLCKAKAARALFKSQHEPGPCLLFTSVLRQVQLIEACVSTWQQVCTTVVPVYVELLHTTHALQLSKALQWHLARACHKLQEQRFLLFVAVAVVCIVTVRDSDVSNCVSMQSVHVR